MSEGTPAGRLTVYLLGTVIVVGAVLLGAGVWLLARGGNTTPEPAAVQTDVEVAPEPSTEPAQAQTQQTSVEDPPPDDQPAGDEAPGDSSQVDDFLARSESTQTVLVRGETPQGWAIESPDGFGFYPVGTAGPAVFTETQSSGFAQSPEGAGFAAIHLLQRLNPLNPDWNIAAANQLVGPGASSYVEAFEAFIAASTPQQMDELREVSAMKTAWVGWSVLEFDPQAAELRLAGLGRRDGEVARITIDVRLEWLEDDWLLVTTEPDASDLSAFKNVADLGVLDIDMREAFAL